MVGKFLRYTLNASTTIILFQKLSFFGWLLLFYTLTFLLREKRKGNKEIVSIDKKRNKNSLSFLKK
jgi:hypothetical protein